MTDTQRDIAEMKQTMLRMLNYIVELERNARLNIASSTMNLVKSTQACNNIDNANKEVNRE